MSTLSSSSSFTATSAKECELSESIPQSTSFTPNNYQNVHSCVQRFRQKSGVRKRVVSKRVVLSGGPLTTLAYPLPLDAHFLFVTLSFLPSHSPLDLQSSPKSWCSPTGGLLQSGILEPDWPSGCLHKCYDGKWKAFIHSGVLFFVGRVLGGFRSSKFRRSNFRSSRFRSSRFRSSRFRSS